MSLAPHTHTHRQTAVSVSQYFPQITYNVHTVFLSDMPKLIWLKMNDSAGLLCNVPAYGQRCLEWQAGLALAVCWLAPAVCAAGAPTRLKTTLAKQWQSKTLLVFLSTLHSEFFQNLSQYSICDTSLVGIFFCQSCAICYRKSSTFWGNAQ